MSCPGDPHGNPAHQDCFKPSGGGLEGGRDPLLYEKNYLASDEKIDLSIEIAAREKMLLEPLDYDRGYSLVCGNPILSHHLPYCSFTSYPISKWKGRTGLYLEALFKEMEYVADKMKGRPLDTIYFGGGTQLLCRQRTLTRS